MSSKKSPKIQTEPALPVVCMVKAGKGGLTKSGDLEKFLPIQVQLSTAGYILGKYLVNFHFSEAGSSRSMWGEVCSKAAEHTEGPWGTGEAAGGKYQSWGELLGTLLPPARALVSGDLSDFTTPKLWPGALLPYPWQK